MILLSRSFSKSLNVTKLLQQCRWQHSVRIGGASGFWGDTPTATTQLVEDGKVDYIIYDYLSEITMSLLSAMQAKNPAFGYAPDFISHSLGPNLKEIKRKGIKIISNAGGINPLCCQSALSAACSKAGVDLKIGVVTGDDLMSNKEKYINVPEMHSNAPLPKEIHSLNAYLGCGPIVRCLDEGADIVITGRNADSALALAPLMHKFKWDWTDYDLLAAGSLAGHLIECGTQVTGGIFTDWKDSQDWQNGGFPIAEVTDKGSIFITKPENTGGLINFGTVCEQLLYEIGDPRAYVLPDVVCDFTKVTVKEKINGVLVEGAIGRPSTNSFKVSATYMDGFKATAVCVIGGPDSVLKARKVGDAFLARSRRLFKKYGLADFTRTHMQVLGAGESYAPHNRQECSPQDCALWLSVHHSNKKALDIFAMELASAGTGMAPGLSSLVGGRPKPTPILRLHSFLVDKKDIQIKTHIDNKEEAYQQPSSKQEDWKSYLQPDQSTSQLPSTLLRGKQSYRLEDLAYTRSGDKGDSSNVAVIARKAAYLPYIQEALTKKAIAIYFSHLFPTDVDAVSCIKRYEVDGINGLNFILENSLGGGGIASLRPDPQGKAYGQILLDFQIHNMPNINTL